MREIKFRYMFRHDGTGRISSKIYRLDELDVGGVLCLRDMFKQGYSIIDKQRCACLKDKNGVEVYEGDILSNKFKDIGGRDREFRGHVHYYPPNFQLLDILCDGVTEQNDPWFRALGRAMHDLEVIGNIYENAELLKEPHEASAHD